MEPQNLLAMLAGLTLLAAVPDLALAQHEHQQHDMRGSGGVLAENVTEAPLVPPLVTLG